MPWGQEQQQVASKEFERTALQLFKISIVNEVGKDACLGFKLNAPEYSLIHTIGPSTDRAPATWCSWRPRSRAGTRRPPGGASTRSTATPPTSTSPSTAARSAPGAFSGEAVFVCMHANHHCYFVIHFQSYQRHVDVRHDPADGPLVLPHRGAALWPDGGFMLTTCRLVMDLPIGLPTYSTRSQNYVSTGRRALL